MKLNIVFGGMVKVRFYCLQTSLVDTFRLSSLDPPGPQVYL